MSEKLPTQEEVNELARLFVQSYYTTLSEDRSKMNKFFLPVSQFSFVHGMEVFLYLLINRNLNLFLVEKIFKKNLILLQKVQLKLI